jgi:hypothetical protein
MALFGFLKRKKDEEKEPAEKKGFWGRGKDVGKAAGGIAGIFQRKKKVEEKEEAEPVAEAETAGVAKDVGASESALVGMLTADQEKGERRTQAFESARIRRGKIAAGEMEPYQEVKVDSEDRLHYDTLAEQTLDLLVSIDKWSPEYARAHEVYAEAMGLERKGKIKEAIERLESIADILEERGTPKEVADKGAPEEVAGEKKGWKKLFGRGKGIVPAPGEVKGTGEPEKPVDEGDVRKIIVEADLGLSDIPSGSSERRYAGEELNKADEAMRQGDLKTAREHAMNAMRGVKKHQGLGSRAARELKKGVAGEIKRKGRETQWPFRRVGQQTIDAELNYWAKLRAKDLNLTPTGMGGEGYVLRPEERKILTEAIKAGVPIIGSKEVLVPTRGKEGGWFQQKQTQAYPKSLAEVKIDMRKGRIEEAEYKEKVWTERARRVEPFAAAAKGLVGMGKVERKMSLPSPVGPGIPARVYSASATAGGMPASMALAPARASTQIRRATIGMGGRAGAAMVLPIAQSKSLSVLPVRRKKAKGMYGRS